MKLFHPDLVDSSLYSLTPFQLGTGILLLYFEDGDEWEIGVLSFDHNLSSNASTFNRT